MADQGPSVPLPDGFSEMSVEVLPLIADAVICTDETGRVLLFNRAAEKSFGYAASEVIGRAVEMLLPRSDAASHAYHLRSFALDDGEASRLMGRRREVRGRRKNGEEFPAEATISRHTVGGKIILTVVHRDVTERKTIEDQRDTIVQELNHRIANVFAVVSSLVSLTAKSATDVSAFKDSLLKRLSALARTQRVLQFGAEHSATLGQLLESELEQYQDYTRENIAIDAPSVFLGSRQAQALALVIHELATNSAKYGALSGASGKLAVTVTSDGEKNEENVVIQWQESGGPLVISPQRHGFGTTLIGRIFSRIFGTEVVLDFAPEGVSCRLTLPRNKLGVVGSPSLP